MSSDLPFTVGLLALSPVALSFIVALINLLEKQPIYEPNGNVSLNTFQGIETLCDQFNLGWDILNEIRESYGVQLVDTDVRIAA